MHTNPDSSSNQLKKRKTKQKDEEENHTHLPLTKYDLPDTTISEAWGDSTYPVEKDEGDALFKV